MPAAEKRGRGSPPREEFNRLKNKLAHAVLVDAPVDGIAEEIQTLVTPARNLLVRGTAFIEENRVELGLAWIPHDVPVTVHLYLDQKPIPGASGTFEGGLRTFPIPPGMYRSGARLAAMLGFFRGGWKCRLWVKNGEVVTELGEPLSDPDPSNPRDDLFLNPYVLP
jgi:hypothetical protein